MTSASILLAVLVLVGVPVGVGVVAHATAHHQRQLSPQAAAAQQLIAKLEREGATDITCSWTGSGSVAAVSCTGTVVGNPNEGVDAYEFGTSGK